MHFSLLFDARRTGTRLRQAWAAFLALAMIVCGSALNPAYGTSSRIKDIADVQDLILRLKLPLELQDDLDPSVRPEYQRLWKNADTADERQ